MINKLSQFIWHTFRLKSWFTQNYEKLQNEGYRLFLNLSVAAETNATGNDYFNNSILCTWRGKNLDSPYLV